MDIDGLDRYIWEAEAHANELLELMSEEDIELLAKVLPGHWQGLLSQLQDPPRTAFVFLGEGPMARDRRLAKMPKRDRNILWLQARYQALQAARALRLAQDVMPGSGWGYRKAVRHAAEAVSRAPAPPQPEELLRLQLPD